MLWSPTVVNGSPAESAGIQRGDVILKLDHQKLSSSEDFTRIARKDQSAGKSALALVQRGDHTIYTVINPNA
ncbi:MAG TPA: PDZ domain-containing protein [Candidatus Binataceae bacterium]|nr:PDZ domain-containing protein [Candidatus Binataceae bacterium]